MIQSIKKISRNLSILISFALVVFISACGGSVDDGAEEVAKGGSISLSATSSTVSAGQSSIITATVLDGAGGIARDKTVTFSIISNKSGGTITALNNGKTDANGQAIATYTAGSANPSSEVEDSIQASVSGATNVIIVTRTSSSSTAYRLALTADSTAVTAGTTTIVKATVTDGAGKAVSGQAVTFSLLENKSGATLTTLSLGVTDSSGQALAIYKAGSVSPTLTVQDTIQASVTGATGVIIINRTPGSASASELRIGLGADLTSLTAGDTTIVTATVSSGSAPAVGQTVSFTFLSNNSGATLNVLNGGRTDASGQAIAMYRAGANSPSTSVQDTIQASVTGAVAALIITRTPGGGTAGGMILSLKADSTSVEGGKTTILTAKVTDSKSSPVQGEAVVFGFAPGGNQSGAAITVLSGTTDAAGEATALYAAGTLTGATVQDIVQARITGSTKALIITKSGTASGVTAASLDISASPTSIKTDGTSSSTITVHALNSLNAEISGVVVTLGASTGILSAPTVITPGNVTFTCGSNKANRTATITATAGAATANPLPIQITGSTVTIAAGSSSISTTGSTTLTVTVKDAGSNVVPGAAVSLSQSGAGTVTFGSGTGTTNASGIFSTTVAGNTNGAVTITATALGATASTAITVTDAATVFYIDQQRICTTASCAFSIVTDNPNPTAMQLPQTLEIRVNAPAPIANVVFATTMGTFDNPSTVPTETLSVITVPVDGSNKATVLLTTTQAGIATINVYDAANSATNDSLTVAMTSATAHSITIQATPVVVPKSVGTTTGSSTLIAMVRDSGGFPVGNAPVLFSIVNPTGGGETITPVVVMTAATTSGGLNLGEARTSFISGSLPSGATGVKVRASVVGTTIQTGSSPSGNDASIVIGGVAGSIAFGQATTLGVDGTNANYTLDMSVLVSDSNGNPAPAGTIVNLSLWPIAWSTGGGCMYDMDGFSYNPLTEIYDIPCPTCGTFWNEDINENLILDSGEDGTRQYYADSTDVGPGTTDGYITPVNSRAGTVPATVTTDASGVAGFKLTYAKTSSIWTIVRVRASTIVQGTETVGQVTFRLNPLADDVTPTCRITGSPYNF
jgi:hypothetical protein